MDPLLDSAPCGFVSFADDGTILDLNRTLADLLGYPRVELAGWHLQKMLPPGGRIFFQTHVFPILKMHGTANELFFTVRTKSGTDLPMLMNAVRRERDGVFVSDCVLMRMTQREQFEAALLEARRAADRGNVAKAKFLSMMSHDLRAPLTAIMGYAGLLAGGAYGPTTGEVQGALERIRTACEMLDRMIADILTFAQIESGKVDVRMMPVALEEAFARAESLVRPRAESAQLTLALEPSGATVSADPDKLQQVLLNLLTNAIKFTPAGGRVSVSAETAADRVRIHVRDTGVGIDAGSLERVFIPFEQVDGRKSDGVGLGLAISRELVEGMGGTLTVESVVGQGSVFTVELRKS
ncbi:MAG TPA: PAS domain-containing sensor histidine kinase [Thermoanaerobaculia bacterium]